MRVTKHSKGVSKRTLLLDGAVKLNLSCEFQLTAGTVLGETIMQDATERTINETTYWWPRPGEDEPFEKETFYTKVGDQICGVGYYKK